MAPRVFDERSEPPLRVFIGDLLASCATADLAITRIRLASLDLTDAEVAGPERCRVLLGQLDASTLLETPLDSVQRTASVTRLAEWLASDRLLVRSAGIGAWTPDFSLYRRAGRRATCLLGAHYFGNPHLTVGPSVTLATRDPAVGGVLRVRFEELWERGHDVAPAILDVLEAATVSEGPGV